MSSVLALQHIPDRLHIWVIRPQGGFLNQQRPLQQRPALFLMPLHLQNPAEHVFHTLQHPWQYFKYGTKCAPLPLLRNGQVTTVPWEPLLPDLRAKLRDNITYGTCYAAQGRRDMNLQMNLQHRQEGLACSRCRTAKSVSVCATSGWSGPWAVW